MKYIYFFSLFFFFKKKVGWNETPFKKKIDWFCKSDEIWKGVDFTNSVFWKKKFRLGSLPSIHELGILNKEGTLRGESLEPGTSNSKMNTNLPLWSMKNEKNTSTYNFVHEFSSTSLH